MMVTVAAVGTVAVAAEAPAALRLAMSGSVLLGRAEVAGGRTILGGLDLWAALVVVVTVARIRRAHD